MPKWKQRIGSCTFNVFSVNLTPKPQHKDYVSIWTGKFERSTKTKEDPPKATTPATTPLVATNGCIMHRRLKRHRWHWMPWMLLTWNLWLLFNPAKRNMPHRFKHPWTKSMVMQCCCHPTKIALDLASMQMFKWGSGLRDATLPGILQKCPKNWYANICPTLLLSSWTKKTVFN